MADISKRYKLKWSELTPEQKEKSGSRAEHTAKREQLGLKGNKSSSGGNTNSGGSSNSSSGGDVSKRYEEKWSNLTDAQKEKSGSKAEHSARREELGTKGNSSGSSNNRAQGRGQNKTTRKELKQQVTKSTSLRDLNKINKSDSKRGEKAQNFLNKKIQQQKDKIYGGDLDNFDATAGGAGSNKGGDRISRADLLGLEEQGHSREDIVNMVNNSDSNSSGHKAQKLLNKWKSEFVDNPMPDDPDPVVGTDPDPVGGTNPDPGNGSNPDPGNGTNPDPGNGTNPDPGNGTNPDPGNGSDPDPGNGSDPVGSVPPIDTGDIEQRNDQDITNKDVNNTDIDDSFNGGTVGDIDNETNIVGNNNIVDNSVDNSNNSRYYGGNNTVWNIQKSNQDADTGFALGGGNYTGGVDTTLSDLTTYGYGKPDDSPAANAKFVDMYQTMNSDAQKKYADVGTNVANKYIQMGRANNPVDFEGIQKTLSGYKNEEGEIVPGTAQDFFNRALTRQTMFMGDYANFPVPNYTMPEPPDPISNDLEETASQYGNY